MITVEVPLGDRSYPVLVGDGARHELGSVLPEGTRRAAVVTQANIGVSSRSGRAPRGVHHRRRRGAQVAGDDRGAVLATSRSWGLTRADCVIGVGGGIVTDVAGFAASVYHRGLPVVHVATTLLAQIDAAIGGKTGVNLPGGQEPGRHLLAAVAP